MEKFSEIQLKKLIMGAGILALFAVTILAITMSFGNRNKPNSMENTITITGKGEVVVIPDIASFNFTIEQKSRDMVDAQKTVTEKMNNLLAELEKNGIEKKDITTESYQTYPNYEWKVTAITPCTPTFCPPSNGGSNELTGYTVSHNVRVKVRDITKTGDISKLLVTAKVTNLSGPNFEVDDIERLTDEAESLAIADARKSAQIKARDLGVRLGRVVSFYTNDGGYPMPMAVSADSSYMMKTGAEIMPTPTIPTGEGKITRSVSVVFSIK